MDGEGAAQGSGLSFELVFDITGDINFMADGEQKFKVGRRFVPGTLHLPLPTIFLQTLWESIFASWIEISQPLPTYMRSANNVGSRIDRGWTTAPASMLINFDVSSSTLGTPEDFAANRISDHAPLGVHGLIVLVLC